MDGLRKNTVWYIGGVLTLFLIGSCTGTTTSHSIVPVVSDSSSAAHKSASLPQQGESELAQAVVDQDAKGAFPSCTWTTCTVYELNGHANSSGAESVFRQRTGRSKNLSEAETHDIVSLISRKKSYGLSTAACHEPRIGIVFYDSGNHPCAYLSLCLACNNIYTKPKLGLEFDGLSMNGFSLKSRRKLRDMFTAWGFPDYNFSWLYDDEDFLRISLKHEGLDSAEIEARVKQFLEEMEDAQ